MRFVRNRSMPEWGLGVVASNDGCNLDVLFEAAGHKRIQRSFANLVDVADNDVEPTHPLRQREEWPRVAGDVARAKAKRALPMRFESLMQEFLTRYPGGLRSEECEALERRYKWNAVEYARKVLNAGELATLLSSGKHEEILRLTRRVLGKTNLAFPNELMKFDDRGE